MTSSQAVLADDSGAPRSPVETAGTSYLSEYRRNGYAVVRGVFGPDEVAEMAAAFDRIYQRGLNYNRDWRHKNTLFRVADDPNLGHIVRMVQWPAYFDPTMARFRIDERLRNIVAPLIGTDIKQIINQMHWKPPGAAQAEFGYHQDVRSRRPRHAYRNVATSYVQTGIAIDPHGPDNGAMTMVAGSHAMGELPFDTSKTSMAVSKDARHLEAAGLDLDNAVDLVLEPGDVALWGLFCVHGSGPNSSDIDRRFYLNGYVRADDCDRGEWAFRDGAPVPLGEPVLVHYEDLYRRPEPHYVDTA